jgi:tetratricopeptide (TPR) repeat protein
MNSIRRRCLIAAAAFTLTLSLASLGRGASSEVGALNKRVLELLGAGKFAEAIPLAERELAMLEMVPGSYDPDVATALNNLGLLYRKQGRYTDAERLYKRALAMQRKALRPDYPDIAISLNNLAALYDQQGRYADAEPLYKRSLAIRQKALRPDDPDVVLSLNNLATLYERQGRYSDAESFLKQVLAIRQTTLRPDHPDIALSLNNLAAHYDQQGRYAEAEALYKRSLAIRRKALGPYHPDVAQSLNNLALIYREQRRNADAEPLYKRSLAISEKALGPDHPDVATALNNLALLYQDQSRYADAEPLLKRAMAIAEKAFGPSHPSVAKTLNNLALLYESQGRYAEAEQMYNRSLAISEKALGFDHPDVATALNNLALLYDDQARYAAAEPLCKRALAIWEKTLGPDHPEVATALNNLAALYNHQGRYSDAEPLYERALAIREKTLGPDHPDVAIIANNLADSYRSQGRYGDALPLVRRTLADKRAATWSALPVLFGAWGAKLLSTDEAIDDGLNVVQRSSQTAAGLALNALTVRFAAGNDRLAQLVRQDQDLAGEAANLDKAIIAAVSKEPSQRDAVAEQRIRGRVAAIAKKRDELQVIFRREYPDYAALSNPQPLAVKDIQPLLADDEALVVIHLDRQKNYIWAINRNAADWNERAFTAGDVSQQVAVLRRLLDSSRPFDPQASFELYRQILAPVEDILTGKPRLSLVLDGALTSLPPQLLVTRDPSGRALRDVDWLVRSHAVTVLPSIASLKELRSKSAVGQAPKPLVGFANPIFDPSAHQLAENTGVTAEVAVARVIPGTVADVAELRALTPLPDTADELKKVAASVHADPKDIIIGADATETRVKAAKLDQYGIVYFATHGLLAGEVSNFAKLKAEPALVLSLPEHPTELDDGLLTASEVAQLTLNADWVVLSACNTAAAAAPGAEALSGLARAFFYAGARSLVVSNWEVNSESTVELMTGMFAALAADPKLSHGEALQKSMLAMIDNMQHPDWADPTYWAPFVVVGEPAKRSN